MSSDEVEEYLAAVAAVRSQIESRFPEVRGLDGFYELYRSRSIEKTGNVNERLEYKFHGFGCHFVESGGAEVDVDFEPGRSPCSTRGE